MTRVGTTLTGWSRYEQDGICDSCGASSDKRTLYARPLNPHDPDEGLLVICFLCILDYANDPDPHV
jgi:hypothetical protein